MTYRYLFTLFCLLPLAFTAGCGGDTTGQSQIDYRLARIVSDAVAEGLVKSDAKNLYALLDAGFQTVVKNEGELAEFLKKMGVKFGQPLEFEYKHSEGGQRTDGSLKRPSQTFWYAARTTKYPKGKYFLKIEIVPSVDGRILNTSGFGLLTYEKPPSYLQ